MADINNEFSHNACDKYILATPLDKSIKSRSRNMNGTAYAKKRRLKNIIAARGGNLIVFLSDAIHIEKPTVQLKIGNWLKKPKDPTKLIISARIHHVCKAGTLLDRVFIKAKTKC